MHFQIHEDPIYRCKQPKTDRGGPRNCDQGHRPGMEQSYLAGCSILFIEGRTMVNVL
jgi:hypothetical protein